METKKRRDYPYSSSHWLWKTTNEMNNNYHPRRICSGITAWVPYAYRHIQSGEPSFFYPSFDWNFPDFVRKEWSAERSFVSSGCLLCITQTLQTMLQRYVFYFIRANFSGCFLQKNYCVRTQISLRSKWKVKSEKWRMKNTSYSLTVWDFRPLTLYFSLPNTDCVEI